MTNQTDSDFELSGPSHLTSVNWHDEHYRRSVMASLVKGVYVLEDDRHREGSEALAPPWWESFNFKLVHSIMDDGDCSVIGAVYKYKPKSFYGLRFIGVWLLCFLHWLATPITTFLRYLGLELAAQKEKEAPKYVIAFRGTMLKQGTFIADMKLNTNLFINKLHQRSRFQKAMQAVQNLVSEKGAGNIWLTGHSLGAAVAMLAGKTMAKEGIFLESYLYNPPFIAAPMEVFNSGMLKDALQFACSSVTLFLTAVFQDDQESKKSDDLFTLLSPWTPNLFLHRDDIICSGYISYFEHREMWEKWGLGLFGRSASRSSWQGIFMKAIGLEDCSEDLHLIPSARVTTSCNPESHKLGQWFTNDSVSDDPKMYRY